MSSLFSFSSGQKDHLILVVVAATTTIFTFRNNTSEQYQRNTDIIPKLFDIVPKVNIRFIRSALGDYFDFRPQKANHNLKRVRTWGLGKAFMHCLLSATALNLKRMVKLLTRQLLLRKTQLFTGRYVQNACLLLLFMRLSTAPFCALDQ